VGTWTAEHIPGRQFDGSGSQPETNEDADMSAPVVLVAGVTEREAREALVLELTKIRGYGISRNSRPVWTAAAELIEQGENMIHIPGRGYRIRDVSRCEKRGDRPHGPYLNCPNCLPGRYWAFTQEVAKR
jgi:hypothetical protein